MLNSSISFLSMSSPDAEEEDGDLAAKVTADPAISVSDLEYALERYFKKMGYRNVQEALDLIKENKVSWKSAPKVNTADWI